MVSKYVQPSMENFRSLSEIAKQAAIEVLFGQNPKPTIEVQIEYHHRQKTAEFRILYNIRQRGGFESPDIIKIDPSDKDDNNLSNLVNKYLVLTERNWELLGLSVDKKTDTTDAPKNVHYKLSESNNDSGKKIYTREEVISMLCEYYPMSAQHKIPTRHFFERIGNALEQSATFVKFDYFNIRDISSVVEEIKHLAGFDYKDVRQFVYQKVLKYEDEQQKQWN